MFLVEVKHGLVTRGQIVKSIWIYVMKGNGDGSDTWHEDALYWLLAHCILCQSKPSWGHGGEMLYTLKTAS